MEMEIVEKQIQDCGGSAWLENLEPKNLFSYLKSVYIGSDIVDYRIFDEKGNGWLFFSDILKDDKIGVKAFFYQKGNMPVFYPFSFKRDDWCWYLVYEVDDNQSIDEEYLSRFNDLREIVFSPQEKEGSISPL